MANKPEDRINFADRVQIAREILAYLQEHPKATDTLEGIVQWWLLQRKIIYQTKLVREAIADLVSKDLVLERTYGNSMIYQTNRSKQGEIRAFLNNPTNRSDECE
jgi:hypothetical protein